WPYRAPKQLRLAAAAFPSLHAGPPVDPRAENNHSATRCRSPAHIFSTRTAGISGQALTTISEASRGQGHTQWHQLNHVGHANPNNSDAVKTAAAMKRKRRTVLGRGVHGGSPT